MSNLIEEYFPELSEMGWELEEENEGSARYVLDQGYGTGIVLDLEEAGFNHSHSARGNRVYTEPETEAVAGVTDDQVLLKFEYPEEEKEETGYHLFDVENGINAGPR